jgi:hypothetical protein
LEIAKQAFQAHGADVASPFYGIVQANHHRVAVADESIDEQAEQAARQSDSPRLTTCCG